MTSALPQPPAELLDPRHAARELPDDLPTASAQAHVVRRELPPLLQALHNPSPQPFRLATAALAPTVSLALASFLSDAPSLTHPAPVTCTDISRHGTTLPYTLPHTQPSGSIQANE